MKMSLLIHADFEGPGLISKLAKQNNIHLDIVKTYRGEALPPMDNYDMLVIMGGPQSASDEYEKFPYLANEVEYIQSAIKSNKKVLGFCLGAQLIGRAYKQPAERSPFKEVGLFPIKLTASAASDPLLNGLGKEINTFHWHRDMPGVSDDFTLLAASDGCPRQIIKFAKYVYGFQCHIEIEKDGAKDLINHCGDDLTPGSYIQRSKEILEADFSVMHKNMEIIFQRFIDL